MYAQRKKCIWLTDKPYMHWFLHVLVTGKLVVSQSVLVKPRGASLKQLGHVIVMWRAYQHLRVVSGGVSSLDGNIWMCIGMQC
jgi:hypothetical protein